MKRQKSHYQSVTEIGYATAKKLLPLYRHKNSPHRFTWPQLVACVLMTFYLDCSYRDMEDWLLVSDKICHSLGLQEVPDHTTLCRAFHRLDIRILQGMQRLLLQKAGYRKWQSALTQLVFEQTKPVLIIHFEMADQKRLGQRCLRGWSIYSVDPWDTQ